jgi:hypothetical protein
MGRVRIWRFSLDKKYLYIAAALAGVVLIGAVIWYFSQERLPGYNIDPVLKQSYVEPNGKTSEYVTGIITKTENSILGPKMTVKMDINNSRRTFYVAYDAPVWLGLIFGKKEITGVEKITFAELKKGWRVAAFIGTQNKAKRINVLRRPGSEGEWAPEVR